MLIVHLMTRTLIYHVFQHFRKRIEDPFCFLDAQISMVTTFLLLFAITGASVRLSTALQQILSEATVHCQC